MKKILLFCFILLIPVNFLFAQWENDVRLTNDPFLSGVVYGNSWAIASSGDTVHVVWFDERDGNLEIYYKRSIDNGTTWGSDTRLTNASDTSRNPGIAVQGSKIAVVWMDKRDGNYEIYCKTSNDGGINWGSDTRLTNQIAESFSPSIAIYNQQINISWVDSRDGNYEIYYIKSTDFGLNWNTEINLTNDSLSQVTGSISLSNSYVYVVWADYRDGNGEIYFRSSSDYGLNWGSSVNLLNNPFLSNLPSVASSGSNVHVTWLDNRDDNNEIYYKNSTDYGATWSSDKRITFDSARSEFPNISVSNNNIHLVWVDKRDGFDQIYYNKSTDNGVTWDSVDTRLSQGTGFSQRPTVCVSGSYVHTVWQDTRDGNYEVYYKRNPTGNSVGIVNLSSEIPDRFSLFQNYPNPFNPFTNIKFQIRNEAKVKLAVYDISGREIRELVNEKLDAGTYEVRLNGEGLSSGVYYYRLITDGFSETKKMILVK